MTTTASATAAAAAAEAAADTTAERQTSCNPVDEDTNIIVPEETIDDWNLPMDFRLFARHERRIVWLPPECSDNDNDNNGGTEQGPTTTLLQLECVEGLTPLDMVGLSSGSHDATGHCAWLGAYFLVELLGGKNPSSKLPSDVFAGCRVLELGCGTGIAGLALLLSKRCRPSHVCFTDADPDVLHLCQRNCQLNFPSPSSAGTVGVNNEGSFESSSDVWSVASLVWGQIPLREEVSARGPFDTVLATDVVYNLGVLPALLSTASSCLSPGGRAVVSHVPRACRTASDHNANDGDDDHNNNDNSLDHLEDILVREAAKAGLDLERVVRPSTSNGSDDNDKDNAAVRSHPGQFPTAPRTALNADVSMSDLREVGAALFVFVKAARPSPGSTDVTVAA